MTTINIESLLNRTAALGEGPVQSAGRIAQGEGDHTGVHPRADVDHIINPGQKSLNTFGVATPDPGAKASYTQVYEVVTPGNSVFEMNDTSGSERIMLRHPTGVGINIGPDGAVVVSSTGRVDVVNEDYNLSVGGDGALTYKGNLRLSVTGDLSIDVGGQFSVTAQEANEEVRETKNVTVHGDRVQTTRGNATDIIVGDGLTQVLGGQTTAIKGDHTLAGESKITVAAGADLAMTSTSEVIMTAPEANIAAQNLSVFGAEGTIGGAGIIAYVKNIHGTSGIFRKGVKAPTFVGTLKGKADAASMADAATGAGTAGGIGASGSPGTIRVHTAVDEAGTMTTHIRLALGLYREFQSRHQTRHHRPRQHHPQQPRPHRANRRRHRASAYSGTDTGENAGSGESGKPRLHFP